jgi:integrase
MPVLLAAATGMRRGEILGLQWNDVDLGAALIRVERSLEQTADGLKLKSPKTKRSRRSITLPQTTVDALTAHQLSQKKHKVSVGPAYEDENLVCAQLDGSFLNPRSLSKEFTALVKSIGITPITFHGLRHTHITQLLASGVHPKVASERAGHASVSVTLDIYSHVAENLQRDAASRIDEIMQKGRSD